MKNRNKKIGSLRLISRIMFLWFIILVAIPIIVFTDSCSFIIKKSPEKYINIGEEYYNKKNYSKAYNNYTKSIELNGFYTKSYWQRAIVDEFIDSSEKSINDWGMFISLSNNQNSLCTAYYKRGNIMFKNGYKSDGCDDWKTSCELNCKSSNKSCDSLRIHCK